MDRNEHIASVISTYPGFILELSAFEGYDGRFSRPYPPVAMAARDRPGEYAAASVSMLAG